jgi:hypothetical protein
MVMSNDQTTASALDELRGRLLSGFKALYEEPPEWAWPYPPSIPLVGEAYKPGEGLLVYGSAENFSWMNRTVAPPWFEGAQAWDRYRVQYEALGRHSDDFFPYVGIQPVTDGGLFCVALLISLRYGLAAVETPRPLLEHICLSNVCKFTVRGRTNTDYAGHRPKLAASLPYVVQELQLLRPRCLFLPASTWKRPEVRRQIEAATPATTVVPALQCNPIPIHTRLGAKAAAGESLAKSLAHRPLPAWVKQSKRIRPEKLWNYLAHVDECAARAAYAG